MTDIGKLEKFFRPGSVAIVGASPQRGTMRNTLLRVLLKHGYGGRVYPVTPSHGEVEGLKAYASVDELPETPDLALVCTPAPTVAGIIGQCGARGVRNAIVYSSGFEEVEGGKEIAQKLAEAARRHDVAVIGPNCQGVWSVRERAMLTFGTRMLDMESIRHGPVAVVSQSGAMGGAIGNTLQSAGIGCSYIVSVGNETCLDALDMLDWVIRQEDVGVVGLYVEGLDHAGRIRAIAERARERGVQIVLLKTGRSDIGQRATASHTGKIASSHAIYADVLGQAGIIAVDSFRELLAAMEVFAYIAPPRSSGDPRGGAAVLSCSGGGAALLADHSADLGVPLAEFSPASVEALKRVLPPFAQTSNPVDLTGQVVTDRSLIRNATFAAAEDRRVEAVLVQFGSTGRSYLLENAEAFKTIARDLPVITSFFGETGIDLETTQSLREAGVLLAPDPSLAMNALSLLYQRQRAQSLPRLPQRAALPARAAPRDWTQAMQFCEDSGLAPPRWLELGAEDRAGTACAHLAYPLVVKVLPSDAEHKTEMGLVRLRVQSPDEVDALAAEFRRRMGKPHAGILVQEIVGDGVEVVLSCLRQTDFGPVMSIGTGGIAIELYRDLVHVALPASPEQVLAALRQLKLWTLLKGFRGKPPADVDALVAAAVRFGDLFVASTELLEFELNPVIVRPRGLGLKAVDALVTRRVTTP